MVTTEKIIRLIFDRVRGMDRTTKVWIYTRDRLMDLLRYRINRTHNEIEKYLSGKTKMQDTAVRYLVRIRYPYYSHLDHIFSLGLWE